MAQEHIVLTVSACHVWEVLQVFERKDFRLVALKASQGMARAAFAAPNALLDGQKLASYLLASLPATAHFHASSSFEESLALMHGSFQGREIVQWEPSQEDEDASAVTPLSPYLLMGSHNKLRENFQLCDLVCPTSVGSEAGRRFCEQLRRDSFVPLLLSNDESSLYHEVERMASQWFNMSEDEKLASGGAYGHIDRKFTGYRAGKFREQLEVRVTAEGGIYPCPEQPADFGSLLQQLMHKLDAWSRRLLAHISDDVGAPGFFEGLLDDPAYPQGTPKQQQTELPTLCHPLVRICKYESGTEGVYGTDVLCEAHNDVGFITLDPCASTAGLEALRRSDNLWIPIEHAPAPEGKHVVLVMVGDTLARATANYYAPCKHRVVAPIDGERIGLPYLFRGRSDAVLNTLPIREAAAVSGQVIHLAEMETTTIKELPAFDSAKAILKNWFKSVKTPKDP